jgi:HAMP domain-containing protein
MLALVAAGVLIVGAVLTSAMIFGPARRRLRALETAARQLGSGDLTARAPRSRRRRDCRRRQRLQRDGGRPLGEG